MCSLSSPQEQVSHPAKGCPEAEGQRKPCAPVLTEVYSRSVLAAAPAGDTAASFLVSAGLSLNWRTQLWEPTTV